MSLAPKPYAKTTRNGHTIDQLTNYALFAVERRLKYTPGSLTVIQGSYNGGAGAVAQSAGTHDGGGAVDLTAANWQEKVHALRAVGFAAWHRPPNWDGAGGGEHIHCILIGDAKLSPSAARQVTQYRNHTNGLANFGADNTWHPNPIPTFHMPKYAQGTIRSHEPKRLSASDIFHVHGSAFYYEEDSLRGVRLALAKLLGIDLDVQKTKDGVLVVCHGPRLLSKGRLGGFYDPLGLIHEDAVVSELTWAEVSRLRSRDHQKYRISRADTLIPKAVKAGVKVAEAEAKTPYITTADWSALRAKISDPSKVRVKAFPKFLPSLEHAHAAGFPTIALTHKGQNRLPKSAAGWLDYFRGRKPIWV